MLSRISSPRFLYRGHLSFGIFSAIFRFFIRPLVFIIFGIELFGPVIQTVLISLIIWI